MSFPSKDWDDFVGPIVFDWLKQLRTIRGTENTEVLLRFMDGPHSIRLGSHDGRVANFSLETQVGTQQRIVLRGHMRLKQFISSVLKAAEKYSRCVEEAEINDRDVRELQEAISSMNALLRGK
jgi:hypothetical protein